MWTSLDPSASFTVLYPNSKPQQFNFDTALKHMPWGLADK